MQTPRSRMFGHSCSSTISPCPPLELLYLYGLFLHYWSMRTRVNAYRPNDTRTGRLLGHLNSSVLSRLISRIFWARLLCLGAAHSMFPYIAHVVSAPSTYSRCNHESGQPNLRRHSRYTDPRDVHHCTCSARYMHQM